MSILKMKKRISLQALLNSSALMSLPMKVKAILSAQAAALHILRRSLRAWEVLLKTLGKANLSLS
jgi:hypothetical protein